MEILLWLYLYVFKTNDTSANLGIHTRKMVPGRFGGLTDFFVFLHSFLLFLAPAGQSFT